MRVPEGWAAPFAGSDECLSKIISKLRLYRPKVDASLPYTAYPYPSGKMVQIWINTPACKFSVMGKCSICDYWNGVFSEHGIDEVCSYLDSIKFEFDTILLNTCGSVLCEEELPFPSLLRIIKTIGNTSVRTVIIETHLAYVDIAKIIVIKQLLENADIIIEYGQESTSEDVLRYCLNKPSMITHYSVIDKLHETGVKVIANVVLGSPFLTVRQRIQDASDSITDLFSRGVDGIVLFPVNIKPYTLVSYLYKRGFYKKVRIMEIVEVLKNFCADDLVRIDLAWFEPQRENLPAYSEAGLGPELCSECGELILKSLLDFSKLIDGKKRKLIIEQMRRINCHCRNTLYEHPNQDINEIYSQLILFSEGNTYAAD